MDLLKRYPHILDVYQIRENIFLQKRTNDENSPQILILQSKEQVASLGVIKCADSLEIHAQKMFRTIQLFIECAELETSF